MKNGWALSICSIVCRRHNISLPYTNTLIYSKQFAELTNSTNLIHFVDFHLMPALCIHLHHMSFNFLHLYVAFKCCYIFAPSSWIISISYIICCCLLQFFFWLFIYACNIPHTYLLTLFHLLRVRFSFYFLVSFHFLGLLSSFSLMMRFLRTAGAILMGIYNFSPKSELFLLLSASVVSCIKWNCIAFSPIFCVCCFMAGHRTTASAVGHQWRALRKSTIL